VRIGITGHSNLAPDTVALVRDALRELLANLEHPLVALGASWSSSSGPRITPVAYLGLSTRHQASTEAGVELARGPG
jgi:hypothetical protein